MCVCVCVYRGEHRREGGGLAGEGRRQLGDSTFGNFDYCEVDLCL